jgi:cytochrome P450
MDDLATIAKIDDPLFYNDPFGIYARMRAEDPVLLYPPLNAWVLSKYDDIRSAARQPEVFSNSAGIFLTDAIQGESIADDYFGDTGELISSLDHPRHSEIRRVIAPAFAPAVIDAMEDSIRADCIRLLDQIEPGKKVDWIAEVAETLPLIVTGRLLGLPGDNIEDLARWSDEIMKFGQILTEAERAESIKTFSAMNDYIVSQFEEKRANPGNDVLSVLLAKEYDRDHLSIPNILALASAVLAGGNETTRALLGNIIWAFAKHPQQRKLLADDPSLAMNAVQETLRWKGPVHGFIRKVIKDTELRDKQLKAGEFAYLLYSAANRDEEIWDDAESFIISREPDPVNLAFGAGPHRCPGNRLAALEAKVLMEELIDRFPNWELAGTPRHIESLFRNGFYDMPVIFSS